MAVDPFRQLGLDRANADADAVRRARRRLARENHPDVGGDAETMRAVNAAAAAALAEIDRARSSSGALSAPAPSSAVSPGHTAGGGAVRVDRCSFTIEVLPVDAHEVLCVAAVWLGEVVDDDPPYLLEVDMHDPLRAWCRLELVPDAGATTVSLAVSATHGPDGYPAPVPDVDRVRDLWVDTVNRVAVDDLLPPS